MVQIPERNFTFTVSIDPSTFNEVEKARGATTRSAFVRDAIQMKLAGAT